MEILFMVFMIFVSVVCLFSVLVVVRDIVRESLANKRSAAPVETPAPAPAATPIPAPVAEAPAKPEEVPAPAPVAEAENEAEIAVSFGKSANETLDEKYNALSTQAKNYYDAIVMYAAAVEGARRFKNARYEEYKIGSNRIVRLLIKRETVVCEFIMGNTDFRNYVNENKVSVRQAATVLKVVDDVTLQAAKDGIDIATKAAAAEREYKKQIAREKRKAARKAKAE